MEQMVYTSISTTQKEPLHSTTEGSPLGSTDELLLFLGNYAHGKTGCAAQKKKKKKVVIVY